MPTRSGTWYHLRDPTSEMDPNFANITNLLEKLIHPIWQCQERVEKQ